MDIAALSAPFPAKCVSWRVGSTNKDKTKGMALAYIDARDVMERLDAVCGPENWQDRYEFHGPRTVCYLSIRIGDEWITKADGAGDSDVEAEKGAISDALKRAAVKWGVGRYLYSIDSPWVLLDQGKYIANGEHARLAAVLEKHMKSLGQPTKAPEPKVEEKKLAVATPLQLQDIRGLLISRGKEEQKSAMWASGNRVGTLEELHYEEAHKLIGKLNAMPELQPA
jgi:hypothetical protein